MAEHEHEHEPQKDVEPQEPQEDDPDLNPDAEPQEPQEAAQEPAAASTAKSEDEIEKALKAVAQAGTRYRTAVDKAMGEDALDLVPCPRCNAPVAGMVFPPNMAPVDDETRDAVLVSIGAGSAAGPPLEKAQGVETCPSCKGNGQLEFPTFVEHTRVQQCPKCMGSGYVNAEQQQQGAPVYTFPVQGGESGNAGTSDYSLPDSWGRPIGHPHYGTPPAQVGT